MIQNFFSTISPTSLKYTSLQIARLSPALGTCGDRPCMPLQRRHVHSRGLYWGDTDNPFICHIDHRKRILCQKTFVSKSFKAENHIVQRKMVLCDKWSIRNGEQKHDLQHGVYKIMVKCCDRMDICETFFCFLCIAIAFLFPLLFILGS